MNRRSNERVDGGGSNGSSHLSFERACIIAAWLLAILAFLTFALPSEGRDRLTATLTFTQDFFLAPILLTVLLLAPRFISAKIGAGPFWRRTTLWVTLAIVSIILIGWAGHYLVFSAYDLSRDEQMANFDAAIFRGGRLFAPMPPAWRPLADALNLTFMLPIGAHESWVSAYLPVNAAWRAAVGTIADPAFASPLMAALGAFCIWRISRLLWPGSAPTQLVSVLLYAASSQVLMTAMTAFSMSMHVALNMLWLWLFLIDRRRTHAAAMIVGWFATGIHQPLFHPLFVLPFLLLLFSQRRWKLLAAYLAAYGFICLFWLAWPLWISSHGTTLAVPIEGTSGTGFFERLSTALKMPGHNAPWTMAANLLRFACWQHPLLIPLAIVGTWGNFHRQPVCRALAIGFVLPIVVMAVLLPWQGYGWGYRYVHPVLGNIVLLAAYGWRTVEARIDLSRPFLGASAVAILIIFPIQAVMAHRVVSPFAQLHREMTRSDADILIVDADATPYSDDLVINRPDLANRPKLLLARDLKPEDLDRLCRWGSVGFVPGPLLAPVARLYRSNPPSKPTPEMTRLMEEAPRAGCTIKSF